MRKPIVAGNWKMNKTVKEAVSLVNEMTGPLEKFATVEKIVCPPFPALFAVSTILDKTSTRLGAQNLYWEAKGAYTGEVSPQMLAELCQYVIIGHSERREHFGETDQTVNRKIKAAFQFGLTPIVCVGETLEQNKAGQTAGVVIRQIRDGLQGINVDQANDLIIAYEPIWAIGTGLASSAEGANEVIGEMIRPTLTSLFGDSVSDAIRILYGGSVKPNNAREYFMMSDIDGALVGGASLKAEDFTLIVQAAVQ